MKSFWISLATLSLSLTLAGCGKKAEVKNPESHDKTIAPSNAEVNFYVLKEIKRTVYENDLKNLRTVLKENPNIHLRFSSESFLLEVRKFLFTHREIWKDIDLTTLENMWLPKSTIFNSNLSIQDDFFLEVLVVAWLRPASRTPWRNELW